MSGREGAPLDPEKTKLRINLSTAVLMTVAGVALTAAVSAGTYMNRLDTVEKTAVSNAADNKTQDSAIAELRTNQAVGNAQYIEILRQLNEINRKIEQR